MAIVNLFLFQWKQKSSVLQCTISGCGNYHHLDKKKNKEPPKRIRPKNKESKAFHFHFFCIFFFFFKFYFIILFFGLLLPPFFLSFFLGYSRASQQDTDRDNYKAAETTGIYTICRVSTCVEQTHTDTHTNHNRYFCISTLAYISTTRVCVLCLSTRAGGRLVSQ